MKTYFKDREHAGQLLAEAVVHWFETHSIDTTNVVVLSLLRGGWPVGKVVAQKLNLPHLPITAAKIGAPFNEEVAVGAVCFDQIYFNQSVIGQLKQLLSPDELNPALKKQLEKAQIKTNNYITKFRLDITKVKKQVQGKIALVVDDGVATGATVKAAALFLKQAEAQQVVLAVPVSPADFECQPEFDKCIILLKDPAFQAVGQYYKNFGEVELTNTNQQIKSSR